ncbi:hypothetical protein L6R49_24240 [Myxococcota bacterium]|nr:hypothetical protein [Myxococcota bacterium]
MAWHSVVSIPHLLLALSPLACTKVIDETPNEDSRRDDSPTAEDSATKDSDSPADPEVTLRFFTTVDLGGYGFKSEEGEGTGFGATVPSGTLVVYQDVPGHWWPIGISPDLTACNQGKTALVNDGETYDWTFIDLPGEFFLEEFVCIMP